MTTAGPSNFSVGALAPILALAALGLGIAALIAPLPFLRPPQLSEGSTPALVVQPRPKPAAKPIVPEDWSKLGSELAKLREPVTEAALAAAVTGATPPPDEPPPDSGPAQHTLRWRYIGYISEPDRVAALMLMNDADQRLLYAGQSLQDEDDPEQRTINVISVTESEVVVERDGHTERFKMSQAPDEPASATSPLRPSPTPPRGGRAPRRR